MLLFKWLLFKSTLKLTGRAASPVLGAATSTALNCYILTVHCHSAGSQHEDHGQDQLHLSSLLHTILCAICAVKPQQVSASAQDPFYRST